VPGANNRIILISLTNLEIGPAAPRSVCAEGRDSFNSGGKAGKEGKGK